MTALQYWLWLSSAGLSPRAKAGLLERFGDAEAVFRAPEGAYAETQGVTKAEASILEARDLSLAADIYEECRKQNIQIISLQDAAYPKRLKHSFSPPVVLYVKGDIASIDRYAPIAVIGTRKCSAYGERMGRNLGGEIARSGGAVVSLLTSRIECAAAEASLEEGGLCVGVLGTPHERETRPLAARVAERGALISEYPPFTRTVSAFFRERNRIAAALSVGVLVVEAPEKSGTRLFVEEAAELGREIFAVPGNADSENSSGTIRMIQDGAKLVTNGWDVMSEFEALYPETVHYVPGRVKTASPTAETAAPSTENAEAPVKKSIDKPTENAYIDLSKQLAGLSETQLKIVAAIDRDAKHIDDIIEKTGLPTAVVLAQLTMLEVKRCIRREPGHRFSVNVIKK